MTKTKAPNPLQSIVALYNLAVRGKYEVSAEGARQMQDILVNAEKAIKQLAEENKDDADGTAEQV